MSSTNSVSANAGPSFASRFLDALKPLQPFLAGGIGGGISMTCIMPVDTVKVRIQCAGESGGKPLSPFAVARQVMAEDGVAGLYRGLSAAWARQMVYGSSRIGLFRVLSDEAKARSGRDRLGVAEKIGLGMTAGGVASIVGTPCDVALVRMQADSMVPAAQRRNYTGIFDALRRIVREEGVAKLWRGAAPTVVRAVFLNAALLATNDQMKEYLAPTFGGMDKWQTIVISSFVAGVTAAVASLPPDMIKTRLQRMGPLPDGSMPYKGVVDCAVKITTREGPLALYTGLPTYIVRIAPYGLITLVATEMLSKAMDDLRAGVRAADAAAGGAAAATLGAVAAGGAAPAAPAPVK